MLSESAERLAAVGAQGVGGGGPARRLVRVDAGEASFVLDLSAARGLVRGDGLQPAAEAPEGVVGWLPRGGDRVPVFTLAERLGLPGRRGPAEGAVVVFEDGHAPWGLLVDRVVRLPGDAGVLAALPRRLERLAGGRFAGVMTRGGPEGLPLLVLAPERLAPGSGAPSGPGPGSDEAKAGVASLTGEPAKSGRVLLFRVPGIDQATFAVSFTQVEALTGTLPAVAVPGALPELLGLAVWRDAAVPLVDLRQCLSGAGPERPTLASHRLLVVRGRRPEPIAFPVASELRPLALPQPGRRRIAVPGLDPGLLRGAFDLPFGPVVVPDLDRLLPRS